MVEFITDTKPTNKKHIDNLLKLADFLESDKIPPPNFHMDQWALEVYPDEIELHGSLQEAVKERDYNTLRINEVTPEKYASCNTAACAVGHGPLAGIKVYRDYDWWDYAKRVFGAGEGSRAFEWLFAPGWSYTDNTPKGAAKRIRIYVENGVPDNYWEQRRGADRLMYKI